MSKLPKTTLDNLREKLVRYETRIKEIKTILAHTLVTFEENKALREYLRMYEGLAKKTSSKIRMLEIKQKLGV